MTDISMGLPLAVIFAAGTQLDHIMCDNYTAADDDLLDCDHDFTLSLDPPTGNPSSQVTVVDPSTLEVTIQDNESEANVPMLVE